MSAARPAVDTLDSPGHDLAKCRALMPLSRAAGCPHADLSSAWHVELKSLNVSYPIKSTLLLMLSDS